MTINHVLAVVAVSDFDTGHAWYQRLFDTPATNIPMPGTLAEWRVTDNGWLQMTCDPDRAGSSLVNFAVDDLAGLVDALRNRELDPAEIITANKDVQLSTVIDPDGNSITFIGNFREHY
jgi:glyoxylase I family protein